MLRIGLTLSASLFLLSMPTFASAQVKITFEASRPGKIDILTPVVAPDARCISLAEGQGLLAFGHDRASDPDLSLVKLDARGIPSAASIQWKVPEDKWHAKQPSYIVSVALHPKLPLLYAWRDVPFNPALPLASHPPELKTYDHLLIYSLASQTPELLASLCRGEGYAFGQQGGELLVDPEGKFLYVPNVKELKTGFFHFGRFRLDADGLPAVLAAADEKLPAPQRAKRLGALNVATPVAPPEQTPTEYIYVLTGNPFGCGHSFHVISNDAIIAGGWNGLISWRPDDKVVPMHALAVRPGVKTLIKAHPALPCLYATAFNTDSLYRVEQVEGYLTMVPQQWVVPEAKLTSAPAVFGSGTKVAVGAQHGVYVVSMDDKGRATAELTFARVFNPAVRTLLYSPRFDRLYVGVELSK